MRSLPSVADIEVLDGGIANAGAVVRLGDHVLRPSSVHTPTIHAFLRFLRDEGFEAASRPIGIDADGRERLTFIRGDVAVPPYPAWAESDMALATAAALLRRMHDVSARYVAPATATWSAEMADPDTGNVPAVDLVICHNDVCLENLVYRDRVAVGLVDFDFAAPGRRVHDLATFARMNVPIDTDEDAALLGRCGPFEPTRRLRIIADAYGLPPWAVPSSWTCSPTVCSAGVSSCSGASTKATWPSARWSRRPAACVVRPAPQLWSTAHRGPVRRGPRDPDAQTPCNDGRVSRAFAQVDRSRSVL